MNSPKSRPSLPQGTRDFAAATVRKREYILDTIKTVFELYGFEPLQTPAMENLDTLMGKYGEEGDKLIFKILNNGLDNPEKEATSREAFESVLQGRSNKSLTERALRYDLTIPFARYVAMNHGALTLPYKRYAMQPVWRADRPQRGRYREFWQCDADVAGSTTLWSEVEFVEIYRTVFQKLGLEGFTLSINSRHLLTALAEACGGDASMLRITTAIDKLDKIGLDAVLEELRSKGLDAPAIEAVHNYLSIAGTAGEKLAAVEGMFPSSVHAAKGVQELRWILERTTNGDSYLKIDLTLARGLDYYTGAIFEAKAPPAVKIGSIGGGGRYDDLTGTFGVPGIPGVGISFGVDRIYDVLEELGLFPDAINGGTQVLFFNLGEQEAEASFVLMQGLRSAGISCELYHTPAKMDKQFKWAEKRGIQYAAILGPQEMTDGKINLKKLATGEQKTMGWEDLISFTF